MKFGREILEKILIEGSYVTQVDLSAAHNHSKEKMISISDALIELGSLTTELLGQAIAEYLKLPYADLSSHPSSKRKVLKIPESIGRKWRAVLFNEGKNTVVVTSDSSITSEAIPQLQPFFDGKKITLAYSLSEDIDRSLLHYQKPLETRFRKIIENKHRIVPEIIDEIFKDALSFSASDIHFEPKETEILVRFRIDGLLQEAGLIPKKYYPSILNRVKIKSNLRIDQHASAMDGSMHYQNDKQTVDMRVSIIPTISGEKIVIRLLTSYVRGFALADLGLSHEDQKIVELSSRKPFGMIVVTGPTGSGKTTTVYSLAKLLNHPQVNITTIEDPVEYKVTGLNQIQVNEQTNLTFAKGLRSIVRQDPDIIFVGEIRDEETAEIAVNAALTGHLLLSTFHSNDAATTIPRLLNMSVEPFLLASTLDLIISQRLIRRIHDNCRYSVDVSASAFKKEFPQATRYFHGDTIHLYRGKGCVDCGYTGYTGRIAIYEIISVTEEMGDLILTNPSRSEVSNLARKHGTKSLFEDGVEKVKNGVTTIEELLRITVPPHVK